MALTPMYAEQAVVTSPMFQTVRGRDAIADAFRKLFTLWPDYRMELNDDLFIVDGHRAGR